METNRSCTFSSSAPSWASGCPQMMRNVVSSGSFNFSSSNCTFFSRQVFDWLALSCVLFNWQDCLFFPHFLKEFWVKLLPAPFLVLEDSVCCQSLGSNDTFCDFCRTLISACSLVAFFKIDNSVGIF